MTAPTIYTYTIICTFPAISASIWHFTYNSDILKCLHTSVKTDETNFPHTLPFWVSLVFGFAYFSVIDTSFAQ